MKQKKILYIDMDGVLCDFDGAVNAHPLRNKYKNRKDCIPGIFKDLKPLPGAIEAFEYLWDVFDVYILSTPPWRNPDGWIHKKEWVEKHIPKAKRRLILTHHKNLNKGDYLIDDTHYRGQAEFGGQWIHFNTPDFPNWVSVLSYLGDIANSDTVEYESTDTNEIPYTEESSSDSFDENTITKGLDKHIKKISENSQEDQFKIDERAIANDLDAANKEQADMYNAEVEKMNQMMEELGNELKGLKNISHKLNTKK